MKYFASKETKYYGDFKEFLVDIAKRYKTQTAITTYNRKIEKQEKTFENLADDVFTFAKALFAKGINGKHIAIVSENCYEWLVAYFGTAVSGGVAVCIDTEHSDETISKMILQADANNIVCSNSLSELCKSIKNANSKIDNIIVIGAKDENDLSYEEFILGANNSEAQEWFENYNVDGKSTASIVYTSGTTSTAKPVMLSHKAILSNAADSLTILDSREKIYNSLPLYHTYGLTCGILCGLIRGINVCISCDLKRMMQEMTKFKPNLLVAVPLIVEVLYKTLWSLIEKAGKKEKLQKQIKLESLIRKNHIFTAPILNEIINGSCLENLNVILSGGAYLDKEIAQCLNHFGIIVLQGYGITECSPSISCNRNEDFTVDSVGAILPGNEIKFVDNEILVKGYSMMNGYYNEPELTAKAYDGEWFKTGDLGYLDKKGHLHIIGRKKNLIVMKNGKKVAVEEMENMLLKCQIIKEVMVYGALSGTALDDVKIAASIYPNPYLTENMNNYEILEQLQAFVDELNLTLPIYKQIQMINIRETEFDKTSSKKIKRHLV